MIEDENAITVKDLDINGHVIMEEFGIAPGPMIGKILNQLLELVLDDPAVNRRDVLVEKAREIFASLTPGKGDDKDASGGDAPAGE